MTNTLAYLSGAIPMKRFTAVIYEFSLKARVFVLDKPFKPSVKFLGKVGANPSEAPLRCTNLGSAPGSGD